ncbi:MAG: lytic transglycosylase domain-containing protein, partial [Pseudomonadota bacterium]|nr:lytic transglycosylase domain-containing protein [Pseudomonadota bacterium]
GLARDRFAWRLAKRRTADAVELLLERSTSAESLKEPWAWGNPRRDLTREAMRDGRHQEAYKIASTHFLTEGSDFAELEWLSGYIALRFLKEPKKAVEHFRNQLLAVDTPISLGRAGYWIGRAEEAAGNVQAAQQAYEFGGAYQTSFYGLLAAEKAGMDVDPRLAGNEEFPDWKDAEWLKSSVYQAAVLLLASDELDLGERFLTHLAESLDRTQIGQMGRMLADFERPHVQVMLGKRAAQVGMEMHASYYALHPLIDRNFPIPTEMVLAIARRESEFDPKVISHAGARGLMQLMPRTAEAVSGWLGKDYELSRLTSDPEYNAELGSAYLAKLAEDFNGNVVMMSAGYNAGPSRPE